MADKKGLTTLASGAEFGGELKVPGTLRIDGVFKGTIHCGDVLIVGKNGRVEADLIKASDLLVEGGIVHGVVNVEKLVQIENGATLIGDITAKELVVNKGAIFHGNSIMLDKKGKPIAEPVAKIAEDEKPKAKEKSAEAELELEELK